MNSEKSVDGLERRNQWPTLVALGAGIVILVGLGSWFAGEQHERINGQQTISELVDAQRSRTALVSELGERTAQLEALKRSAGTSVGAGAAELDSLRRQVQRQQASLNDYQTLIDRDKKAIAQNELLLNALGDPNAQFLSLSAADSGSDSVAYALILPEGRLILIASHLESAPTGREYQLWLIRHDDPKIVSAGTIEPDESERAVVEFSDRELVSAISEVTVTEEPIGGSKGPTGPKVFVTNSKTQESGKSIP